MTSPELSESSVSRLRTLQVIVAALAIGVAAFQIVVLFLPESMLPRMATDSKSPLLTYIGVAVAVIAVVTAMVLPDKVASGTAKSAGTPPPSGDDCARALNAYFVKTVMSAALLEAPALLLIVAYLIERQTWSVIVVFALIGFLMMQIPSRDRFERWMQRNTARF